VEEISIPNVEAFPTTKPPKYMAAERCGLIKKKEKKGRAA